ncbi:MAG: M23 family metallopeptidase, partial [Bacteroidota bacterium]
MKGSVRYITLLVFQLIFWGQCAYSQQYPQGYFRSPLDIPLYLSGNFGELRTNHFHTGLDIKTEGREGLNVYASATGWVSRLKVSAFGYGLIVYVEHPNGFTSCYAHLSTFNQRISDYVKLKQYQQRAFEVDFGVPAGEIPVTQGEIIGLSGNSGGSGGPHLHFEIRDTKTELALNPLLFGLDIADDVRPSINAWRAYAFNTNSSVDYSSS